LRARILEDIMDVTLNQRKTGEAGEVRAALQRSDLLLSSIAFQTGISRTRLKSFRDKELNLTEREVGRLSEVILDPEFDDRGRQINDSKLDAVSKSLCRHSVAYLTRKRGKPHKRNLASGTLVTLGDRVFVATASHTIPDEPAIAVTFVGERPADEISASAVIQSGKRPGNRPDVGYLELPVDLPKTLDREPIVLSRLSRKRSGTPGQVAFLSGYPEAWASPILDHRRRIATVPLRSMTYANVLLARDEWPNLDPDAPRASRLVDLFLAYPTEQEMEVTKDDRQTRIPKIIGDKLPSAVGTSGGGIWQNTPRPRGLWYAELNLIGVQSAWSRSNRYARGVQVFHWLKLIHDDYPDLRPLLTDFGLGQETRADATSRRPK
jgi:hypothetical protein